MQFHSSLTELNLSGNQLESLPGQIGQLQSLQSLDLWQNPISSLPEELNGLTNLHSLKLPTDKLSASELDKLKLNLMKTKVAPMVGL